MNFGNSRFNIHRRIAAEQRRHFNNAVDSFDLPQPESVMDRLRRIVAAAGLHAGETVFDVGTGVGVLIPLIESYRPSLILAGDLSERMLARLHVKYPRVRVIQMDITLAPFAAGSIDAIIMNAMYGNIADKEATCREAARMLRPGGRLIVSHPEGKAFVDRLRVETNYFIESLPDRAEFETVLQPIGLTVTAWQDEPRLYLMVAQKLA